MCFQQKKKIPLFWLGIWGWNWPRGILAPTQIYTVLILKMS